MVRIRGSDAVQHHSVSGAGRVVAHQHARPAPEPSHPATTYFAERLQELASTTNVDLHDGSGRMRKLTPLRLQKLLKEQAPDLPVSQTQIYRYYHGEAAPRLDVVWELAHLLGVSPRHFLPE